MQAFIAVGMSLDLKSRPPGTLKLPVNSDEYWVTWSIREHFPWLQEMDREVAGSRSGGGDSGRGAGKCRGS
jgi:hypothetical protein